MLGGRWTDTFVGAIADRILVHASGGVVRRWCARYGLKASRSYSFNAYGRVGCAILASAWSHRIQFFFEIYDDAEDSNYGYSETDIGAYFEQLEFESYWLALTLDDVAYECVEEIKAFKPARPVPERKPQPKH